MENTCPNCGHCYDSQVAPGLKDSCPKCMAEFLMGMSVDMNATKTLGTGAPNNHASNHPLRVGSTVQDMEILEFIGQGGMGFVYKARQKKLNRIVALKILDPRLSSSSEFTSHFNHEAKVLAALSHANIVQVYDYGKADEYYYLAMEYVDGATLRSAMTTQRMSPETALRYVPQICDALQYAHAQGVIHRDIKPENILIDKRGSIKIADFGLAKMLAQEGQPWSHATATGRVMGTPHYMAPEQMKGMALVDHRADIYSLGVVFYEMLTGELPLGRFPNPSTTAQIDVHLDEVVLRALEQDPARRYQHASEVKDDALRTSVNFSIKKTNGNSNSNQIGNSVSPEYGASSSKKSPEFCNYSLIGAILLPWGLVSLIALGMLASKGNEPVWFYVIFLPFGLISALVATVLGWVSITRIRNSGGRYFGTGLALLDGLFYPVIILNILLSFPMFMVSNRRLEPANGSSVDVNSGNDYGWIIGLGYLLLVIFANSFVIAMSMRYAYKSSTSLVRILMWPTVLILMIFLPFAYFLNTGKNEARSRASQVQAETRLRIEKVEALQRLYDSLPKSVSSEDIERPWLAFKDLVQQTEKTINSNPTSVTINTAARDGFIKELKKLMDPSLVTALLSSNVRVSKPIMTVNGKILGHNELLDYIDRARVSGVRMHGPFEGEVAGDLNGIHSLEIADDHYKFEIPIRYVKDVGWCLGDSYLIDMIVLEVIVNYEQAVEQE